MNSQVVRADKAYRIKIIIVLLCFLMVAAGCVLALMSTFQDIERISETDPDTAQEKLRNLVTVISIVIALFSAVFAAWFIALAYRIVRSGQYPPPGMRVLKDTKLRTGRKARIMAAQQIVMALLVLCTNIVMWYLNRFIYSLG